MAAICKFITKDNINSLIKEAGIEGEIGILSVDIDGNDYWVWKAIEIVDPIVVIIEYNSLWGYEKPYTIIYQDDFVRTNVNGTFGLLEDTAKSSTSMRTELFLSSPRQVAGQEGVAPAVVGRS